LRVEGKNYVVQDGDIIEFKFNAGEFLSLAYTPQPTISRSGAGLKGGKK
jgi:hypothetical protein